MDLADAPEQNPVPLAHSKQSLRKRAVDAWRASVAKPIADVFHRHTTHSKQSDNSTQDIETSSVLPDVAPRPPLKPMRSFFGSVRSRTRTSNDPAMLSKVKPSDGDKQQGPNPRTPQKSFRDRLRRTFSRHTIIRREASSSPIDIPTVKKELDPSQKPIPLELTGEDENPLQWKMRHSPGLSLAPPSSPSDSAGVSPLLGDLRSPMPGTTFPLDVAEDSSIPFEQAYDFMMRRNALMNLDPNDKIHFISGSSTSSFQSHEDCFSINDSDPFIDSPRPSKIVPAFVRDQHERENRQPKLRHTYWPNLDSIAPVPATGCTSDDKTETPLSSDSEHESEETMACGCGRKSKSSYESSLLSGTTAEANCGTALSEVFDDESTCKVLRPDFVKYEGSHPNRSRSTSLG